MSATTRIDERRSVGQHRQGGRLAPRETPCRPAVVTPGGGVEAHHIAAERSVRDIQAEDLLLAAGGLQPQRQHHLHQLVDKRAAPRPPRQPYHLHGDRAAAADDAAGTQVLAGRPQQGEGVDTRMTEEILVLVEPDGRGKLIRHTVGRRETPLTVGGDLCPQQLSLPVRQHRGRGIVERDHRQEEEKDHQGQEGKKSVSVFLFKIQNGSFLCNPHPVPPPHEGEGDREGVNSSFELQQSSFIVVSTLPPTCLAVLPRYCGRTSPRTGPPAGRNGPGRWR